MQRKEWQLSPHAEALFFKCIKIGIFGLSAILLFAVIVCVAADAVNNLTHYTEKMQFCKTPCGVGVGVFFYVIARLGCGVCLGALCLPPKGCWWSGIMLFWVIMSVVVLTDTAEYVLCPGKYPVMDERLDYIDIVQNNLIVGVWGLLGVVQVYFKKSIRIYTVWIHMGLLILYGAMK